MRDAFGGAFMIKVMLIFLGIYIAFMAVALNYAKAFRVKNQIINIIEQYEGYEKKASDNTEVKDIIGSYLETNLRNVFKRKRPRYLGGASSFLLALFTSSFIENYF